MKVMWKRWCRIVPVAVLLLFGSSFSEGTTSDMDFSAWITYWDVEKGQQDWHDIHARLTDTSYFAAYFDGNDHLFIPEELQKGKLRLQEGKKGSRHSYLTVVNDVVEKGGTSSLKDMAVLQRLFQTEESLQNHASDVLRLAKEGGYDGVEIDYEGLWKRGDSLLQSQYVHFLHVLVRMAEKEAIPVRVVLEPSVPFDAGFPRGASYVVMLYNLYGPHSGPGPKADDAFIQRTCRKMAALPGPAAVALATGGVVWRDGKNGTMRTEEEARQWLKAHAGIETVRDEKSGALKASYTDGIHEDTLWYADSDTLNHWAAVASGEGYHHICIWRLGGNTSLSQVDGRLAKGDR